MEKDHGGIRGAEKAKGGIYETGSVILAGQKQNNMTDNEKKAQQLILLEINKALDLLENHLKKFCTDNKAQSVPIVYISASIKIIKENMAKGATKT